MFVPQRFKAKLFGGRFHVFVLRYDQHAGKALPRDRLKRMLDKRLSVYHRGELVLAKARGITRRHDHASYFQRVIHLLNHQSFVSFSPIGRKKRTKWYIRDHLYYITHAALYTLCEMC